MNRTSFVRRLRKIGVLEEGQFTLRSGKKTNFYCNIKKSFGSSEILNLLADQIAKKIPKNANCVVASGLGGLPLASVVSSRFGYNLVMVREELKSHGRKKLIDGYFPIKGDRLIIIDDVLTTGVSISHTLRVLKTTKASVVSAIIVLERESPKLSIPYRSILKIRDL
jgi:orotate phosphoribosyltransferase